MQGPNPQILVEQTQSLSYSGPLPLPAHFEEYNRVAPGAGIVIMEDFRQRGKHSRFVEKWLVVTGFVGQMMGTLMAGALTFYIAKRGFDLLDAGRRVDGMATLLGSALLLAATFIAGKRAASTIALAAMRGNPPEES